MPLRKFDDSDFDSLVRAKFDAAPHVPYDSKAWSKLQAKRGGAPWKIWIGGAAVLVLLMIAGWWIWQPFSPTSKTEKPTAELQQSGTELLANAGEDAGYTSISQGSEEQNGGFSAESSSNVSVGRGSENTGGSPDDIQNERDGDSSGMALAESENASDNAPQRKAQLFNSTNQAVGDNNGSLQANTISREEERSADSNDDQDSWASEMSDGKASAVAKNKVTGQSAKRIAGISTSGAATSREELRDISKSGDEGQASVQTTNQVVAFQKNSEKKESSATTEKDKLITPAQESERQNGKVAVADDDDNTVVEVTEDKATTVPADESTDKVAPATDNGVLANEADALPRDSINLVSKPADSEPVLQSKGQVKGKFTLSLLVNTDLSTVKFQDFTTPGLGIGVRASYRLSNRFSVSAGFTKTNRIYDVTDREDYTLPAWILANQGWPEGIAARCSITEIPVSLRYDVIQGRNWNLYGQVSASSFMMDREVYDFESSQYGDDDITRWEVEGVNKHYFGVVGATVGYERYFARRWGLGLEFYWQTTLGGIGIYSVGLNSLGNHLILNYRL